MTYARIFITLCGVSFLGMYVPGLLVRRYSSIEQLHAEELMSRPIGWYLVGMFGLLGLLLFLWTVFLQVKKGRGTPVPLLPPERLLVDAPYTYCRNPMALGAIMYYFGVCVYFESWDALFIVAPAAVLLLAYIKVWEEHELESRFGQAYREYRIRTPFLIPRIFGRRWYYLFLR
jgi:protein-S-isoprenylcysteine O-methyltransferase Ste14